MLSSDSTDFECIDVNECSIPEVCHRDSYCTNYPGTYACACNAGFIGDGLRCLPLCKFIWNNPFVVLYTHFSIEFCVFTIIVYKEKTNVFVLNKHLNV